MDDAGSSGYLQAPERGGAQLALPQGSKGAGERYIDTAAKPHMRSDVGDVHSAANLRGDR